MTDKYPTVLIVEDQEGLAEAYETVVSTEYQTRLATSGAKALESMDETVKVVLLDRRMPGLSGDAVLSEFREQGYSAMVAMLTAVEAECDILEMSFDAYVTKPVDNDELLDIVETLLRRSEYDEPVRQCFRLAAKKSALENAGRSRTAEYQQLLEELQRQREAIDDTDVAKEIESLQAD